MTCVCWTRECWGGLLDVWRADAINLLWHLTWPNSVFVKMNKKPFYEGQCCALSLRFANRWGSSCSPFYSVAFFVLFFFGESFTGLWPLGCRKLLKYWLDTVGSALVCVREQWIAPSSRYCSIILPNPKNPFPLVQTVWWYFRLILYC